MPGITNAVKAGGGGSAYGVVLVGDGTPPPNQDPVAQHHRHQLHRPEPAR